MSIEEDMSLTTEAHLSLVGDRGAAAVTPPVRSRGKLLSTDEIQELYGRFPEGHPRAGQFRKSRWWITHNFAPEYKIRQGKEAYWYESDAHAWLEGHRPVAQQER
jgi:hypothetical protein